MIDIKVQEVFDYFIKEALWRDTIIPGVQWYYAESELYVFRFPAGYHYGFCFIHAKSPEDAGKYFIDKFWAEHNNVFASGDALRSLRCENKALKAENERLKEKLGKVKSLIVEARNKYMKLTEHRDFTTATISFGAMNFLNSLIELINTDTEKGGEDE